MKRTLILAGGAEGPAQRISIGPAICGGKPCIREDRIWVSLIVDSSGRA